MGVIVCGPENGRDNERGWLLNKISILMPMNAVVGASTGADKWGAAGPGGTAGWGAFAGDAIAMRFRSYPE